MAPFLEVTFCFCCLVAFLYVFSGVLPVFCLFLFFFSFAETFGKFDASIFLSGLGFSFVFVFVLRFLSTTFVFVFWGGF